MTASVEVMVVRYDFPTPDAAVVLGVAETVLFVDPRVPAARYRDLAARYRDLAARYRDLRALGLL